jgi:hypothetical protein
MSLDIWFTEDIKNIILAAEQANIQALETGLGVAEPNLQRAYHQGFRAALSTLALAFGLAPLPLHNPEVEECTIIDTAMTPPPRFQLPLPERVKLHRSLFITSEEEREDTV